MIAADLAAGDDAFASVAVTVPQSIAGRDGNDRLTGGSAGDVLAGGNGNDTLDGGAGVDDYFGEAGDDTIRANDGTAERIACGAGTDVVTNDFTDIIAECERGVDGDNDGFATTVDCNDASAAIRPGAAEIFGNGVDEDCNGRDDVNRDVDADGFPVPVDCDDGNAAIRPGALEIRGNAVDENCDRSAESWRVVPALVTNRWALAGAVTRLQTLVVRVAPKDAVVTLSCRGAACPFKQARRRTVPRDLAPVSFSRAVPRRAAALRHAADADDPRRGVDQPDLHLHRPARRAARRADRLPRPRRREGGPVLTRALALALAVLALVPAAAAAGTFKVEGGDDPLHEHAGGRGQDRGLRDGRPRALHPLRRRPDRPGRRLHDLHRRAERRLRQGGRLDRRAQPRRR